MKLGFQAQSHREKDKCGMRNAQKSIHFLGEQNDQSPSLKKSFVYLGPYDIS